VYKSFESIVTRGISILSKFLLITFLAKNLTLADYGMYQLITYFAFIAISIYGFEYYMYGNREVAKGTDNIEKINDHISFFITLFPFTFLLQIIALYFLVPQEILSIQVVLIILFINFCDYFNQEVYRYLIMIQKIGKANLLLIAKSTILLVLIFAYYLISSKIDLYTTLWIMLISYILLLLLTLLYFFKYIIIWNDIKVNVISIKKVKKTLKFLSPFLLLMFFTKGLEFFDKFAIEYFYGSQGVGIYSFLFSIASLIYVFVVSGFYLVYLPEFIRQNEEKNAEIKSGLIKFSVLVVLSSILLSVGIIIFIDVLLNLIDKSDIIENINILYILLVAFFFLNLSLIPGILLYVTGRETIIMKITGLVFIINLTLNIILLHLFNIKGAAIALLVTYLLNFIFTFYKANGEWVQMKKDFL
jgi:O-antigen/teichoic acid export membrane protein